MTPPASSPTRGVILFAHGSRDPLWRLPMDAVARRVAKAEPGTPVRCAFLELTAPDLPSAGAELVALGLEEIRVLPMFLGVGRHAREDLPLLMESLRNAHPQVRWVLQPTVGEDPRLLDLLANLAMAR